LEVRSQLGCIILLALVAALVADKDTNATDGCTNDDSNNEDAKESVDHLLKSDLNLHFNLTFIFSNRLSLLNAGNCVALESF